MHYTDHLYLPRGECKMAQTELEGGFGKRFPWREQQLGWEKLASTPKGEGSGSLSS